MSIRPLKTAVRTPLSQKRGPLKTRGKTQKKTAADARAKRLVNADFEGWKRWRDLKLSRDNWKEIAAGKMTDRLNYLKNADPGTLLYAADPLKRPKDFKETCTVRKDADGTPYLEYRPQRNAKGQLAHDGLLYGNHPRIFGHPCNWINYELSFRFRFPAGEKKNGIWAEIRAGGERFGTEFSSLDVSVNNQWLVASYRMKKGNRRVDVGRVRIDKALSDTWHKMQIRVVDCWMTVKLDGKHVLEGEVPLGRGFINLRSYSPADFADIIFECIVENLSVKQDYFAKLDALCPEKTILATNTSAISVTEIAEKSVHKERIIGTHYWNPAYLIPLVEVIKTKYVSEDVVAETCEILEDAGKKPVIVQKDVPGFLANRMQHALFREAISIVENGIATAEDVDKAIKYGFGMRLGIRPPMEVIDAGGTDLTYSIHKYLFPHIENSTEPSPLLKQKLDEGKLGFKSGEGFMKWSKEDIEKSNKDMVEGLIKVAKALDRI